MKLILTLITLSIIKIGQAQTKAETQVWLSYYLDKYFGSDYNQKEREEIMKGQWWDKDKTYPYRTFVYSFDEKYLLIKEENRVMDSTGYAIVENNTTTAINLKRITMVEPEVDSINNTFIGVNIIFKAVEYDKKENVIEYSILKFDSKGNPITEFNTYALNFHITNKRIESVKSRIEIRLAKSLLHLASLEGAKIVKDLF